MHVLRTKCALNKGIRWRLFLLVHVQVSYLNLFIDDFDEI
jgi:hypothetical protein